MENNLSTFNILMALNVKIINFNGSYDAIYKTSFCLFGLLDEEKKPVLMKTAVV